MSHEGFDSLGVMGWPLAVCSILALMLCLERTVFLIRAYLGREETYRRIAEDLSRHRCQDKRLRDDIAGVLLADLRRRYYSGIKLLRIIGTLSPLLGLLGTILGIISVFRVVAARSGPVSPNMIAEGLWEAMLTTAAGLLIALPALFMAHLLHGVAERMIDRLHHRLNRLSLSFDLPGPKSRS